MTSEEEVLEYLEHFGVKGMRWGVRRTSGVSAKTDRQAKNDAKEFARAKMFYGEGAGTRRKLIKATVESRSKKDPSYKKAFENHLNNQDLSQHASKARAERKRKDVGKKTKQTTGAVARSITGQMGTTAAFTVLALGGLAYLNSPHGRQVMNTTINKVKNAKNHRDTLNFINDAIKRSNL